MNNNSEIIGEICDYVEEYDIKVTINSSWLV
jgi:hypothetical protein